MRALRGVTVSIHRADLAPVLRPAGELVPKNAVVNCDPSWKVTASLIVRERCVPGATPFIYALYLPQNRFVRFVSAFEGIVGRELTETAACPS